MGINGKKKKKNVGFGYKWLCKLEIIKVLKQKQNFFSVNFST